MARGRGRHDVARDRRRSLTDFDRYARRGRSASPPNGTAAPVEMLGLHKGARARRYGSADRAVTVARRTSWSSRFRAAARCKQRTFEKQLENAMQIQDAEVLVMFRRKQIPMSGISRDVPSKIIYFNGPYQAAAQGVAPLEHAPLAPRLILSRLAAKVGRLGQFLAGQKI